ncbi:hypothetical protein [Microbacterium plantarum]|uniref:hypothetical protein n=1 Tax=Microbacterium plantarum TaxID=1816425 RepID=UPI002B48D2F8|nr:hypothetical protein [Microbacterium plantarum]WRK16938.1 hypothetical protein VC184_13655 [Microbacterium plantarum]
MAIETTDHSAPIHDLFRTVAEDRRRLAQRFRRASPAASLAQSVCFALIIAVPALGVGIPTIVAFVVVVGALVGVEMFFRRRLGMAIDLPAGWRSWAVGFALAVVVLGLAVTSMALAVIGQRGWIALTAGAGLVVSFLGVTAYDRTFAADVVRPFARAPRSAAPFADAQRFRLSAALRPVTSARVDVLAESLGHGNGEQPSVQGHLSALEREGLVSITHADAAPSASLTKAGRREFDGRLAAGLRGEAGETGA